MLDPPNHVVAMGRYPEGLFECSAEVMGAQSREPGKRRNRYVRGKVLLDMGRHNSLLPSGETATELAFLRRRTNACASTRG